MTDVVKMRDKIGKFPIELSQTVFCENCCNHYWQANLSFSRSQGTLIKKMFFCRNTTNTSV